MFHPPLIHSMYFITSLYKGVSQRAYMSFKVLQYTNLVFSIKLDLKLMILVTFKNDLQISNVSSTIGTRPVFN